MTINYFDYPLDHKFLIRKKKALKAQLLSNNVEFISKNIAILGGSTTKELVDQLELFLLNEGIKPNFYESTYNKYYEDAVFENADLTNFHPDIIIVYTSSLNLNIFPSVENNAQEISEYLNQEYLRFETIWEKLKNKYNCPIIQNNFERPALRLLGNRDIWDCRGKSNFIFRLNEKLYTYAQNQRDFFINDIDYLAGLLGYNFFYDETFYALYKYASTLNAIPYIAKNLSNIIKSIYGKNKKILNLDLDNTLWGGVIGDDGLNNIKIGPETAQGQVYSTFQNYCLNLKKQGILLSINTKNEYANTKIGLSHPDCILKTEDFVSIKSNWQPKDRNLQETALELNLGLESIVFVDDNPSERELIKNNLPMVTCIEANIPELFSTLIDHNGYFECTYMSDTDLNKTAQYQARQVAIEDRKLYQNYEDYLKSLNMTATIMGFDELYLQRITQLTNKTNQFNLTTQRCSENDIQEIKENPKRISLSAKLRDKFSDHGLVTVISGMALDDRVLIDLWLMSCRVFKRDLEFTIMNNFVKKCLTNNIKKIIGIYIPTTKNIIVGIYRESKYCNI